jgi:predicted ABC-type ATPase
VTNKKKKQVVIVAGANGSGKTTFARKFLDVTKYEFLNADEIAKEMNPQDPVKVRIAAGKQVINLLDQFIDEGKNFVIESTLSGSFLEKHIEELKQKGYEISLTFIFLGSKDLCIERIKSRVRQGGHNVPDEDVIRRFNRGLVKFWQAYRMQVDYYSIVFNNEYYDFKRIAHGQSNSIEIIDKNLYQEFLSQVKEINNEI